MSDAHEEKAEERRRPSGLLRTAEVLEACGIAQQVLYRYVTLGLVEPTEKTPGGHSLFHPRVVPLIKLVQDLKDGYPLRHQKEIFFKDQRIHRALCERGEEDARAD